MPRQPSVSVVIATKNRPQAARRLLEAVAAQDLSEIEVVVVDDGSDQAAWEALQAIVGPFGPRFVTTRNDLSKGPSAARNQGVARSTGRFVAFCDDDDLWTRCDHLSCAIQAMEHSGLDLFFAEMLKVGADGAPSGEWFKPLLDLDGASPLDDQGDCHHLSERHLARFLSHRILHANTLVIRRELFEATGGYWENIRFAEDHDFALRLADAAAGAVFRSTATAQIDVSPHESLSRRFGPREQLLMSVIAVLHAETEMRSPRFRQVARRNRAYRFLELALADLALGQAARARAFAWESFTLHPSKNAASLLARTAFARPTPGQPQAAPAIELRSSGQADG